MDDQGPTGRVVVTGGAGFIGANLVRALLRSGTARHVTVIDDLSTGMARNLDGLVPTDLVVGDLLDVDLGALLTGADAVVHLAALASVPASMTDPLGTNAVNATGTLRVLEAARQAGNVYTVVASSAAVYGRQDVSRQHESLVPAPASPYALSKLVAEWHAATYTRAYGLPTLSFRFFNVYGALQPVDHVYAAAIPAFVSAAVDGRPVTVHGDGQQTRDFVHVSTVTGVLCRAVAERVTATSPVNLASGRSSSLNEVLAALEDVVGRPLEVVHGPERAGDVRHSSADTQSLHELFPGVRPTPLEDGLSDTVDWFRHHGRDRGGPGVSPTERGTTRRGATRWGPRIASPVR